MVWSHVGGQTHLRKVKQSLPIMIVLIQPIYFAAEPSNKQDDRVSTCLTHTVLARRKSRAPRQY